MTGRLTRDLQKIKRKLKSIFLNRIFPESKYDSEINFWRKEICNYVKWYRGEAFLYDTNPPLIGQKVSAYTEEHSAILTWFELHQKPKYIKDLQLTADCFKGMKLLDIGSGPFPNSLVFSDCEVYNLDPLIAKYIEIGYPLFHYETRARFIKSFSESIPIEDGFFDAVISVNAIDHVDDFEKTAKEIRRVLKPGGLLRMHVHYHKPTIGEPLEINDTRFLSAFSGFDNLIKISESQNKTGYSLVNENEKYVVWSNF